MSKFYCTLCEAPRDDDVCPVCGLPTERWDVESARAAPAPKVAAKESPPRPIPLPASFSPPPVSTEAVPVAPPPREPALDGAAELHGQQQIEELVAQGHGILLIAGTSGSGKTELLEAYRADKYLGAAVRKDGRAIPTAVGELLTYPFSHRGQKLAFVDASGEHFRVLYQDPSSGRQLRETDVEFLRVLAKHLHGLVLLLNLADSFHKPGDTQLLMLRNVLLIVRWLHGGGRYKEGASSFQDQIDAQVHGMKRLRIPVQLLLSRADELTGFPIPKQKRQLFPPGEDPVAVVRHCAPKLLGALRDHAHHFRIDFVHSLTTDSATGALKNREGCGVELSAEWLLEANRLRRWPTIPTRWWLGLDEHVARNGRWKNLPPPERI